MQQLIQQNKILWPKKPSGRPRLKRYISDMQSDTTGFSTVLNAPGNVDATKELNRILGPKVFAFPKPVDLVSMLIEQSSSAEDIILDSFAGSGTTAHAVLSANQRDGGKRKYVLVELDANIARNITTPRIRRVAEGYGSEDNVIHDGLGGGFRYCTLGEPVFDQNRRINPAVRFADLARHVYLTETGEPLPRERVGKSPLLGIHHGTGIYLLYNGILADKSPDGGNVLTTETLKHLPAHPGAKIVYGNACRLGEARLRREGIVFKQLPHKLRVDFG